MRCSCGTLHNTNAGEKGIDCGCHEYCFTSLAVNVCAVLLQVDRRKLDVFETSNNMTFSWRESSKGLPKRRLGDH